LARNDDGEFELVLGNRQLISVFIIVVILFAVFFSMGYIIGHNNTAPVSASNTNTKPSAVDRTTTSAPATTPAQEPAPTTTAESKPPQTESPAATHPEQSAAHRPVTPAPVAAAPPQKEKPSPISSNTTARVLAEPSGGEYFQVVATTRPDAEIISEALGKKGFHSVISPSPKEGIFRVLVGPIKDGASQGQMRADLEAAGFKSPILRKY